MATHGPVARTDAPPAIAERRWRPWWIVGTPGQVAWTGFLACLWTTAAVSNLVTLGRPSDYWYAGAVGLMWTLLIANVVACFVRRDLLLLPPRPKSGPARAAFVAGAVLCWLGVVAPVFVIGARPALAAIIAVAGVGLGAVLLGLSRRLGPGADRRDELTPASHPSRP